MVCRKLGIPRQCRLSSRISIRRLGDTPTGMERIAQVLFSPQELLEVTLFQRAINTMELETGESSFLAVSTLTRRVHKWVGRGPLNGDTKDKYGASNGGSEFHREVSILRR